MFTLPSLSDSIAVPAALAKGIVTKAAVTDHETALNMGSLKDVNDDCLHYLMQVRFAIESEEKGLTF
jgi:hypothetical protein